MSEITRFFELFQPEHYDIYLDINRETKQIKGTTSITGQAIKNQINLHQNGLKINSVKSDGKKLNFKMDDVQDAVIVDLNQVGEMTLTLDYQAVLTDSMMGIYPSYYQVDGVQKQVIGTQFETTFARQAFPSIDEPEAKATFDLAIKFDEHDGETILSNMPEIKVENGVHYFDTTVKMSTYLVAFAFGELQHQETFTKSGVKIGVFSTKAHQLNELDFALDIAKRSIEFFEDFYQTPYPLPHAWQLALPDFSAGAMENWGLVTYREAYLLLDLQNTSLATKQLVATVIAHELAHQWFGDLVTMQWWDDLWLNESFANMMEYVAIDALEPDWRIWELFQTSEAPSALQRDATDGVQSVHVQVKNPAEIDALFDGAIVYAKGSRMLVMVRALIGDAALRAGLKKYFETHQYGNATGADLWNALSEAAGMNIGSMMEAWLEQPGYPVVNVKLEDDQLKLSQSQFFIGENQPANREWQIPLNSNYHELPKLMDETSLELNHYQQLRENYGKPFRLNVGNDSHMIVKYDQPLLNDIVENWNSLDAIDQLQIIQDLRLLAEGQQISYATIVPLLPQFAESTSAVVNDAVYRLANELKKFVQAESPEEQNLQLLFGRLSHEASERLGWKANPGETNDDQLTRPYVLKAALYAKNTNVIQQAHQLFEQVYPHLNQLPAAVRMLVLTNEVENFNSDQIFDQLLVEYQQSTDASYKADICKALTSTGNMNQLKQIVDNFEKSAVIKPQDLRAWFRGVLANPAGQPLAWDWIRQDWQWLEDTVGGDMEFTTFITVIAGIFKTPERLAEFKEFFEPKLQTPGLTREITMDIKVVEGRVQLIQEEKEAVNAVINKIVK